MRIVDGRTHLNWPLVLVAVAALASTATGARAQGNANAAAAAATYTLQPGDEIEVSVYGEMELQRKMLIRPEPARDENGIVPRTDPVASRPDINFRGSIFAAL